MNVAKNLLAAGLIVGAALVALCPSAYSQNESAKLYTAYNIWYEKPERVYCVNYQVGAIIPAGTEVTNVSIKERRRSSVITFTTKEPNMEFSLHFNSKYHPGVSAQAFKDRMFTTKSLDELTKGLTEKEKEAIKKGVIETGMSKEAVVICCGYPPEHVTPTRERDMWTYWRNRFAKIAVTFGKDDKVTQVQ